MNVDKIRKRYQRDEDTELISNNVGAMDRFIEMLQLHSESKDERVANIAKNFEYIDKLAPGFIIFEGSEKKDCSFLANFKAYTISKDIDMPTVSHEFGHAVLSIMNNNVVPEDYGSLIARAKQNAIAPENREYFREYIQYISSKTDDYENRTDAEKQVADIISSIFQVESFLIGSADNVCALPGFHRRAYYYDEEKDKPNLDHIFNEDFANYYALKANNCTQELETLRNLFGDEFIQVLDNELTKASNKLELVKESEIQETTNTPMEQIKNVVVLTKSEDIQNISPLEKETQYINYKSNENMEER